MITWHLLGYSQECAINSKSNSSKKKWLTKNLIIVITIRWICREPFLSHMYVLVLCSVSITCIIDHIQGILKCMTLSNSPNHMPLFCLLTLSEESFCSFVVRKMACPLLQKYGERKVLLKGILQHPLSLKKKTQWILFLSFMLYSKDT